MSSITVDELSMASLVLLSRLARPATIDLSIIIPNRMPDGFKLDSMMTLYTGCMDVTDLDNNLRFYLAVRTEPYGLIQQIFVYYFGEDYREVQAREMDVLREHLPRIREENHGIRFGVVNIVADVPRYLELSSFVTVLDHCLGRKTMTPFKTYEKIKMTLGNLAIGPLSTCNLSHCNGQPAAEALEAFRSLATEFDTILYLGNSPRDSSNPEVVLMRFDGHLVGCFYNRAHHMVCYLVVHRNQFLDASSYDRIKQMTSKWYSNGHRLTFFVTRFYVNEHLRCDDALVVGAWRLALWMRPHVLLSIHENEIHFFNGTESRARSWRVDTIRRHRRPSIEVTVSSQASQDSHARADVELFVDSQQPHPQLLFQTSDYEELWTNNLSTILEMSSGRRRIRDGVNPPVHELAPYMDRTQGYLKTLPSYEDGVRLMAQIWSRYAPTHAFGKLRTPLDIEDEGYAANQFIICPIDLATNEDHIVVIDTIKKEWVHLDCENRSHSSPTYLSEHIVPLVDLLFPEFSRYNKRSIRMSCHTHKEYPKLHLLMGLFVISRIFEYARELPQLVIYGEWEIRRYANNLCAELQVVNALHNIAHGLIDNDGFTRPGALLSLPSPLLFEATRVVPKDQCMICKRRYISNLGRHMAAAHGGQARMASLARLETD